jgi:hypothetical protein
MENTNNKNNMNKILSIFYSFNKLNPNCQNEYDICVDNNDYFVTFKIDNFTVGYKIIIDKNNLMIISHHDPLIMKEYKQLILTKENIYTLYQQKFNIINLINKINNGSLYDKVNIFNYFLSDNSNELTDNNINFAIKIINKIKLHGTV